VDQNKGDKRPKKAPSKNATASLISDGNDVHQTILPHIENMDDTGDVQWYNAWTTLGWA